MPKLRMIGRMARAGSRASAALEFALVLPVLVIMVFAIVDLTGVFRCQEAMDEAASAITEMATNIAAANFANPAAPGSAASPYDCANASTTTAPNNCITVNDAQAVLNAVHQYLPNWNSAAAGGGATLSEIMFSPPLPATCSSCSYAKAGTIWSRSLSGAAVSNPRSCSQHPGAGQPAPAAVATTVPGNLYGPYQSGFAPQFVLAADIYYTYQPRFPVFRLIWPAGLTLARSAYQPVRVAGQVFMPGVATCP